MFILCLCLFILKNTLRANFPGDRVKSEKCGTCLIGKSTTFIFCSEIPYGESINVVISFCSNLFFFSRKYSKTVTSAHRHKMTETKATSMATITLLLRSAKVSRPISNLDICKGGINKWFESKNRIINSTMNSRRVFENRHYFIVYKS